MTGAGAGAGPTVALVVAVGVLVAAGVTLLLERSLTRILLGVILVGNGINVLILLGGAAGRAALAGRVPDEEMADPLPQAMVLTAIVITFGLAAFLLAVAYRSWQLTGHDEVRDDPEDRQIVGLADRDASPAVDIGGEGPGDDPEQVDPDGLPDDGPAPTPADGRAADGPAPPAVDGPPDGEPPARGGPG